MFTGIIENLSEIKEINKEGDNLSISLISKITNELKICLLYTSDAADD